MLCNTVTLRFNGAEHWCWSLTPNRRRAFVSTHLPASFKDSVTRSTWVTEGGAAAALVRDVIAFRQLARDTCGDRTCNVRLAVDSTLRMSASIVAFGALNAHGFDSLVRGSIWIVAVMPATRRTLFGA